MKFILLVSFLSTAFNTGLIWTIQLVHYPGFLKVGATSHQQYHAFHMKAISPLVGVSMVAELISSIALLLFIDRLPGNLMIWLSLTLLVGIFIHTAFVAVPLHGKLAGDFSIETAQKLVDTNWWRTFFWSARSLIMAYLILIIMR
jgi:hypothetical protein